MSHLLRYLSVSFSVPNISRREIPAFRAAVAEKVGFENDMFHNHQPDGKFIYRYPLIQYKVFKQQQPGVLCLQEGVDNIYHLFSKRSWEIKLHGEPITLKIAHLKMEQYHLEVKDRTMPFRVQSWQALNQHNYKEYLGIDSLAQRIQFLEQLLASHLLWFAKGVGWQIEKRFDVSITDLTESKIAKYKGIPVSTFDLTFKSNLFIPSHIGIGKGASRGLGTIYPNQHRKTNEQTTNPETF
ncbi:MAG TPA: CRISPR-associated endonuclease Cas6 [Chitinophagales bacterium]|nr:CRISPR-associated endonuclease Cas6 [Chitinophagales bacterium]